MGRSVLKVKVMVWLTVMAASSAFVVMESL
jgi:hypothetical protein